MTTCSVVMVSYYSGPVLFASIKSVLTQRALKELVVVNNGNPPDVVARLQQMTLSNPALKIVSGDGNIGLAAGRNKGTKLTTGEFILFLNSDCLLPPEALTDTMLALEEVRGAKLAGCWMQNPDGSEQRGSRRQLLTPPKALPEMLGWHRFLEGKQLHDSQLARETHEVAAISSAFMCLRTADYQRLNGFDEAFFLHGEELDLCMRVYKMSGKIICVPRVQVTRMLGNGGRIMASRSVQWHKAKGLIHYFHKHFTGDYFPGFLSLVNGMVLLGFVLKVASGALHHEGWRRSQASRSVAARRLMILASGLASLSDGHEFKGKTVLVTGATSHVGLCVVRRLLAAGAGVLAISRADPIPFRHERLRWIKGDLSDESLHLHGYLADIVIHCAPLWHLPSTIGLLADAEVKRIVAFGSTSIFAKALSDNVYEKDLVDKLIKAESAIAELCHDNNIPWTILRPTMIYGVGLDVNVTSLAYFIRRFRFFPVYPPAFGRRQPVHADDLALAALQAANAAAAQNKAYNTSGGEVVTYRDMLHRLFALYKLKLRIVETTMLPFALDIAGKLFNVKHINGEIARRMNDDLIFFHDDATRDFGFSPRSFLSSGIRDIEGF